MRELDSYIRSIPDFPEEGIIFRDVTSVIQTQMVLGLPLICCRKKLMIWIMMW